MSAGKAKRLRLQEGVTERFESATLRVETEQTVYVNGADMRRLFEDLFRNAVEHRGEEVTVTVEDLDTEFCVGGDGSGIPSEDRKSIFERGISGSEQGLELGPFIVEQVIDTHGRAISVTESDTGGARFEFPNVPTSRRTRTGYLTRLNHPIRIRLATTR